MNVTYYALKPSFYSFFYKKEETLFSILHSVNKNQQGQLCKSFYIDEIYLDCISFFDYPILYSEHCLYIHHPVKQIDYYLKVDEFSLTCNHIESNPFCYYLERIHKNWITCSYTCDDKSV